MGIFLCDLSWPVVELVDTRRCLRRGEWNVLSIWDLNLYLVFHILSAGSNPAGPAKFI